MALLPGKWYVLQVRARHEQSVESWLSARGYTVCLPTATVRREWCDRVRLSRAPLFPGYVFARFEVPPAHRMVDSPGSIRIVGFGSAPAPLDEAELESARILAESGLPVSACPVVADGQMVTVARGVLAGVQGRVIRHKGHRRIVVQMLILQRAVFADLHEDTVVAS